MELLTRFFEIIKLPIRYILWIALSSAILLFLPEQWLNKFHVEQFLKDYDNVIGVVFIASTSLVTVNIIFWITTTFQRKIKRQRVYKELNVYIKELDSMEKAVLREFYLLRQNTILLPADQPIVAGLISKGILEVVGTISKIGIVGQLYSVNITPELRKHISLEMIGFPSEKLTPEIVKSLSEAKPEFLKFITFINQKGEVWL